MGRQDVRTDQASLELSLRVFPRSLATGVITSQTHRNDMCESSRILNRVARRRVVAEIAARSSEVDYEERRSEHLARVGALDMSCQ